MNFKTIMQAAVVGSVAVAASAALAAQDYKAAPMQTMPAMASAPAPMNSGAGFVVGIQGGYADTHWDDLLPNTNKDTKGFTARGYIGYDFNQYFGSELGYTYLPKVKAEVGDGKIKNYVVDLFAKLYSPSYQGFKAFAKVGAGYFNSKVEENGVDKTNDTIQPAYGVGLAYEIIPNLSADLSWTRYNGHSKLDGDYQPNPDVFMLGLSYKFPVSM